jgi:hypothetical protein
MSLKFKDEIDFATFNNFLEKDANVIFEFSCLVSTIKNEIVRVLDFFYFFLKKI